MISIRMPLWLRVVSLVGVIIVVTGAGLLAYRWYAHPTTLTLAAGSIDGEAAKAVSAMASQLVSDGASVRLKVIDTGTALESAKQFAAGDVDLAVVRGDVGDLSQAQAIVVLTHATVIGRAHAWLVHRQHRQAQGPYGGCGRGRDKCRGC